VKREAVGSPETSVVGGNAPDYKALVSEDSSLPCWETFKFNRISTWFHYILAIYDPFIIIKLE
jgi:hypothetical protein